MAKQTYSEKLKDPRWQKKRLEILQRDEFMCQHCYDKNNTLHVHHKCYNAGKEPWDIESEKLITLCEDCHKKEPEIFNGYLDELDTYIKSNYSSKGVFDLLHALANKKFEGDPNAMVSIINFFVHSPMFENVAQQMVNQGEIEYKDIETHVKMINTPVEE